MSEVKRYDVQGKFESQDGEGVLLVNPKMVLEDDYDAKCHAAEVYFGSWKRTEEELDTALSQLAALREELANMQHWRDLALQFDAHRINAMWHLKTLVSDGAHYDAARDFLSEPPIPASELQQRLADAERLLKRAVLGIDRLSVTPEKYNSARWEDLHAVVADINAALNKPEEAKS